MFLLDDQQKFVIFYTILWILLGVLFVAAIVLFILRLIRIHKKGVKAQYIEGTMEVAGQKITSYLKDGDIVLTLGAGDITKIGGVINGLLTT